jgi:hypothetical protein
MRLITPMSVVPISTAVTAREAFLVALGVRTEALTELRRLAKQCEQPLPAGLQRTAGLHPAPNWMSLERTLLFGMAGQQRVEQASAWAKRLGLGSVPWLEKWAVFALFWSTVAAECDDARCQSGCRAVTAGSDRAALATVGSRSILLDLQMQDEVKSTVASFVGGAGHPRSIASVPTWSLSGASVGYPLPGPDPRVETRSEFLRRAGAEWEKAVGELEHEGVQIFNPRKLNQHVDWFVRHRVLGQSASEILGSSGKEESTIYKAVKAIAFVLPIPLDDEGANLNYRRSF